MDEALSTEMDAATRYARRWVTEQVRDLVLERAFPDLAGLFYDLRADAALCRGYLPDVPAMTLHHRLTEL